MRDIVTYLLMQIVGSIATAIMSNRVLADMLRDIYGTWLNMRGFCMYSCIKKTSIVYGYHRDSEVNDLWTAIAHYVSQVNIRGNATIKEIEDNMTVLPSGYVWYDNVIIRSYVETLVGDEKSSVMTHTICIYASTNAILNTFIAKARADYKVHRDKVINSQYYYMPAEDMFVAQNIVGLTSFSRLHFPGKDELLRQLARVESGAAPKLNLLLSGAPGCGKTSIISAIAEMTRRSIVEIDFSIIKTPQQLFTLFFTENIDARIGGIQRGLALPNSKRLYVIEEIDTLGKLIAKRIKSDKLAAKAATKTDPDKSRIKAKAKAALANTKGSGLTLGHLLTVLDGVRQTTGAIIVMTTNHVDMIDPALIRDGRINMRLELQPCLARDAAAIIQQVFPDYPADSYPLKDGEITPAKLETCMARATSETLNGVIREITA